MNSRPRLLTQTASVISIALWLVAPKTGEAQYMFLDSSRDGVASVSDKVAVEGETTVDVWLVTNKDSFGMPAKLDATENSRLTVNSYEVILRAEDGEVKFGPYVNLQPTMTLALEQARTQREFRFGYLGPDILPPGKYLLGRFTTKVISGNPSLSIVPTSEIDPRFRTSFGSKALGRDQDNTLKLESKSLDRTASGDSEGDWSEVAGLQRDTPRVAAALTRSNASMTSEVSPGVSIVNRGGQVMDVHTKAIGTLRVTMFDVQGRAVRVLAQERNAAAGSHTFPLHGLAIASGIYFYKVETGDGIFTGRCMLLR